MALSLMTERDDVRLAERPAHYLYFMGTKWIDLWVVYIKKTQPAAHPEQTEVGIEESSNQEKRILLFLHTLQLILLRGTILLVSSIFACLVSLLTVSYPNSFHPTSCVSFLYLLLTVTRSQLIDIRCCILDLMLELVLQRSPPRTLRKQGRIKRKIEEKETIKY